MKVILKIVILFLIQFLESIEYKNKQLDEDDINKKIIDTLNLFDLKVKTDTGYSDISNIHKTQPYKIYKIITESGKYLEGADNHILFDENMNEVFIKDLDIGDLIQTKDGLEKIKFKKKSRYKVSMFDVTVNDENHRFYSNDILSHNTITSSIFLAWYICFHYDKNILVIANKMATTNEIVDKIKTVIKGLPFFLKPGTLSSGATGIKFDSNVRLFSQATTKSAAIGFTIHLLYADEFAHIPENFIVDFWRSIYPTLASSNISRIIISSTPYGMNLFYDIYSKALENKNQFKAIRVDWWQVPGRDESWKEREISNLGSEELFNQEYGNQFLASNKMLLSSELLSLIEKYTHKFKYKEIYDLEDFDEKMECLKWHTNFNPNRIDKEKDKFVFSIDIGDGVGRDYSIINIFKLLVQSPVMINKTRYKDIIDESSFFRLVQIGTFRSNTKSVEQFSQIVEKLLFDVFNHENVRVVMEINFKGHLLFERVSKNYNFYPEIFLHSQHSETKNIHKPGIKIKKDNREVYIRELRNLIRNKRIVIQDRQTFKELSAFGLNKRGKYEAQTGNDDIAMSCVLLIPYFDNTCFFEDVEDTIDLKPKEIIKIIENKINEIPEDERQSNETLEWIKFLNTEQHNNSFKKIKSFDDLEKNQ